MTEQPGGVEEPSKKQEAQDDFDKKQERIIEVKEGIERRLEFEIKETPTERLAKIEILDANGNAIGAKKYEYDSRGSLVSETKIDSKGEVARTWEYKYDEQGNRTKEIVKPGINQRTGIMADKETIYETWEYKNTYEDK